ncbi:MAG: MMPL family transporter [Spirochaetaceae bacterium]|nr:MMPL family transporter [Spirochaetaceae bacterium]
MKIEKWRDYALFLQRRKIPLLITVALLGILSFFSTGSIEMKTRIEDMLPEDNPIVKSYTAIGDEFNTSSILLTVEDGTPEEMGRVADELVALLKDDHDLAANFRAVRTKMDRDFMIDKGFLLSEMEDLKDFKNMTENPALLPFLTSLNDNLEAAWLNDGGDDINSPSEEQDLLDSFNQMENFVHNITNWIQGDERDARYAADNLIDSLFVGDAYFYSPDYKMLIIQISPAFSIGDRKQLSNVIDSIKEKTALMEKLYPHLVFGVSGDIAQEADEEAALGFDALYPALAALIVILFLFYFSLPSLRSILFALIALALGILFDLGLIGVTIKELNMITSSFGALLVGLGIDFGIHIITRYGDSVEQGISPVEAMARTLKATVPPVSIGGITTALAFFALCLSKTKGFVQFGFVAGSGILLVLFAMFTILPLLLLSFKKKAVQNKRIRISYSFLPAWGRALQGKAGISVMAVLVLLTVSAAIFIPSISYDYDMRHIGPQNTPSKATENRIMEAYELSPFPSFLSVNSLEEAEEVTESLRKKRSVSTVSSPSDYLPSPADQNQRIEYIKEWHKNLTLPEADRLGNDEILELSDEVQRLEWNVIEIADISSVNLGDESRIIEKRDSMIREILGAQAGEAGREVFQKLIAALNDPAAKERINLLNSEFQKSLFERVTRMTSVDSALSISDLPQSIRDEMISREGSSFLITVYPTDDIQNRVGMFRFDSEMLNVHKGITGTIPLSLALSKEILSETGTAALAVLAVVVFFLLITFKSLIKTLLAMISLAVGFILMIGSYTLLGEMNLVNILAIPLIIGIAIDYNVHIIHSLDREKSFETLMASTGKSILLSALTTMIGFGSLALLGTFRGIATLGILLFLGTLSALISSLIIIPVILSRQGEKKSGEKRIYIQEELHEQ